MTIIEKLNKKIIAAVLSFAMVLTGIFSFGAIKKETASADMGDFVSLMLSEILEYNTGRKICMIVDNEMILRVENGDKITQLARENDQYFLQSLIDELGIASTPNAFRSVGFYIFAQSSTGNTYVDLITGREYQFSDLENDFLTNIESENGDVTFSLNDTLFCGTMQWTTNQDIINYFKNFKIQLGETNFGVYAKYDEISSAPTGVNNLTVRYYTESTNTLTNTVV